MISHGRKNPHNDDVYSGYDEMPLFFSTEESKAIDFFNNRVSIAHNDIKKHEKDQ